LARAAPYAKHRDNYSTLFNIQTMEPLVAGPPFVQALEELVAAAKLGPGDPLRYDPLEARAAFWRGECGMALTWPTAAVDGNKKASQSQAGVEIPVGFAELPGSRRVFNQGMSAWDTRAEDDATQVPLLAVSGRLGVVSAKSANIDAAFQLLHWLSDSQMSPSISATSPATTLFRQSNLKMPGKWVEKPVSALAAVQYADVTEATMRHEQWLGALRMPGRAEYLAALDDAVAKAVRGEKSAMDALLQADKKWREITERLGVDRQRAAYRHSFGLE
jgi:multiple sugar transport system substrate-binding protein